MLASAVGAGVASVLLMMTGSGVAIWIVTVAVPVSQAPDVVVDAVTVGEPVASRVASPGVVVENVSNVVSLEVQVELVGILAPRPGGAASGDGQRAGGSRGEDPWRDEGGEG